MNVEEFYKHAGQLNSSLFSGALAKFECEREEKPVINAESPELRQSIAELEEERGIISFYVISNTLKYDQKPEKLIWLVQLQRLFGVQLPRMPKEYVTRIVFDRNHKNLVLHKAGTAKKL